MVEHNRFFCVYCEKAYPAGTPIQTLKDHTRVCEKHPLRKAEKKIEELEIALEESVRLQAHYAELLNVHDERIVFRSAKEWVERLREIGKVPKD